MKNARFGIRNELRAAESQRELEDAAGRMDAVILVFCLLVAAGYALAVALGVAK